MKRIIILILLILTLAACNLNKIYGQWYTKMGEYNIGINISKDKVELLNGGYVITDTEILEITNDTIKTTEGDFKYSFENGKLIFEINGLKLYLTKNIF